MTIEQALEIASSMNAYDYNKWIEAQYEIEDHILGLARDLKDGQRVGVRMIELLEAHQRLLAKYDAYRAEVARAHKAQRIQEQVTQLFDGGFEP